MGLPIEACIIDAIKTLASVVTDPRPKDYIEPFEGIRYVGDIDHAYIVLYEWFGSTGPLNRDQVKLINYRHSRNKPRPWRACAKKFGGSRESVRQKYLKSLQILEEWVVFQPHYDQQRINKIADNIKMLSF